MKKRIFATLALLASMALVGCGKKTCEKHQWGSWEQTVAPTCQKEGKKVRTCKVCGTKDEQDVAKADHEWESDPARAADNRAATCSQAGVEYQKCKNCGATNEKSIPQLEHTWDDGVASGNCGEAGTITYTCTACGSTKSETSGYIQHSWVKTGSVDAGDGGLAYDLVKCSKCNKNGLMVFVKNEDGTNNMTVTGTPKGSPTGTVKLGATNDSATAVVKLDAAKTGKLYFRGSMDYWYTSSNQNEQKGIYNGKSTASKENGIANFKMEVGPDAENLTEVALTADKDLLYKDFLPEEPGFTGVEGTDWSQLGDIEVGNVSLTAGLNTIRFTRLDSYNLAIYAFVVAFDA